MTLKTALATLSLSFLIAAPSFADSDHDRDDRLRSKAEIKALDPKGKAHHECFHQLKTQHPEKVIKKLGHDEVSIDGVPHKLVEADDKECKFVPVNNTTSLIVSKRK